MEKARQYTIVSGLNSIPAPYDGDDLSAFTRATDDMGIILRGQLILERCLVHKCRQIFPDLEAVYKERLDMVHCLNLLRLVSAPTTLINSCKKINKIRNDFAHGKFKKLSETHINELRSLLPDELKGFSTGDNVVLSDPGGAPLTPSEKAHPRAQFKLIVLLLQMLILTSSGKFVAEFGFHEEAHETDWKWKDPRI